MLAAGQRMPQRSASREAIGANTPRKPSTTVWARFSALASATRCPTRHVAGVRECRQSSSAALGGQLGFDFASRSDNDGGYRFGLTGGYASQKLNSRTSADDIRLNSYNIGAYAGFTGGLMFGSLLAKYDHHKVEFDAVTTGFDEKTDGSTWGIEGEVGAQLGDDVYFIEPVASLAWTRTDLDDVDALGQRLDFDTANGLRGKIGANFGGRSDLGGAIVPFFARPSRRASAQERRPLAAARSAKNQGQAPDRVRRRISASLSDRQRDRGVVETMAKSQAMNPMEGAPFR